MTATIAAHPLILPETSDPPLAASCDCLRTAAMLRARGRDDLAARMEANAAELMKARTT